MRKLLNDPFACVDEMLDGLVAMKPVRVRRTAGGRGLIYQQPNPGRRVRIITGGGSGHEPAFFGWLGAGLADAAAVGNVFASPSAEPTIEIADELPCGDGVLFAYGNYDGDRMNFDMAAEFLEDRGVHTRTLRVTDDVVSAPNASDRRGVAGGLVVLKAAGARADEGASLDEVWRTAAWANERTRSAGVGLGPCIVPTAGVPTFDLPEGFMDIGMGVHGERGMGRSELRPADQVADELLQLVMSDGAGADRDPLMIMVNTLGATPLMEALIVYRRVAARLADLGLEVRASLVGEFVTSLEMAGLSLTITDLDPELERLLSAPSQPLIGTGFGVGAW